MKILISAGLEGGSLGPDCWYLTIHGLVEAGLILKNFIDRSGFLIENMADQIRDLNFD